MHHNSEIQQNKIKYFQYKNEGWVSYVSSKLNEKLSFKNNKYKIHISTRFDVKNIQKTIKVILPILIRNQIMLFKHIDLEGDNLKQLSCSNLNGKTFCIYRQQHKTETQESSPEFWLDLYSQIEKILLMNGIEFHPVGSRGDVLFLGSKGYLFERQSFNIFNQYIGSELLEELGFTRLESAHLSRNNFFYESKFNYDQKLLNGNFALKLIEESDKEQKNQKLSRLIKLHLTQNNLKLCWESTKIIKNLIFKSYKLQIITRDNLYHILFGSYQYEYHFESTKHLQALLGTDHPNHLSKKLISDKLITLLTPFLDKAAELTAIVYLLLGFNNEIVNKIGHIIPAIYCTFFKNTIENELDFNHTALKDQDRLIDNLVKCSLRDKMVKQILFENPIFINELTLDQIEYVLQNAKNYHTIFNNYEKRNKLIVTLDKKISEFSVNVFLDSYSEKEQALKKLRQKISDSEVKANFSDLVTDDLIEIFSQRRNNSFFSFKAKNANQDKKTSTTQFIEDLKNEYGDLQVGSFYI